MIRRRLYLTALFLGLAWAVACLYCIYTGAGETWPIGDSGTPSSPLVHALSPLALLVVGRLWIQWVLSTREHRSLKVRFRDGWLSAVRGWRLR